MATENMLTPALLIAEAKVFAAIESEHNEPKLYGVTDGKAVGTYLEQKFSLYVSQKYKYELGNSAQGIDFPSLDIDIKVTSKKQPQSSCPFRSARQKVYGLGYDLLVFVYVKTDDDKSRASQLSIRHVIFVERSRTADYQTTRGVIEILERDGNEEDLVGFFADRNLPLDDTSAYALASEVLMKKPIQGYLTMSNALQWRLQYGRAIENAGAIVGIDRVR